MPLSKGTMGLYNIRHCKCNSINDLVFIYLSIFGVSIIFTFDFLVRNSILLFQTHKSLKLIDTHKVSKGGLMSHQL